MKAVPAFLLSFVLVFTGALLAQQSPTPEVAETIFINGRIYTGRAVNAPDPSQGPNTQVREVVEGIAIRNGRVLAIGSNDTVLKHRGKQTNVVSLGGRFAMPGFNDAHVHLAGGGFEKLNVSLIGTKSLAEMKQRIAARAKTAAPGEWILGRGWDHTLWPDKKLPTRADLDQVTGNNPAVFTRVDGHISVANTAALKLSKITRDSKAPEGGTLDKDASGEPTGVLRESARNLLARPPAPTPRQRRRAMELALEEAARWGVTSAQDNSDWEDFLVLADLRREGKLPIRVTEWLPFSQDLATLQRHRSHHPQDDEYLHVGMLKAVMDGTLGSRTAAMLQPYSDDPGNTGLPQYDQARLNQMAIERTLAGFQLGFHAIGDRATEMALTAFDAAERAAREQQGRMPNPSFQNGDFRFRIEHAQVVLPEHYDRMARLKVIASMQPNHLLTDMNWAESRIGQERARHSYAWAEMLRNNIRLAFGTDYPVEPITPFRGLYAAVTRKNEEGTARYAGNHALTIDQAIAAYTVGAAYAEFAENQKGTLAPGMFADMVVLDRDLTRIPAEEILQTQVVRTVVGGKTVYEAR